MVRRATGVVLVIALVALGSGCRRLCRCCCPCETRGPVRSAPDVAPAERIPPAALPISSGAAPPPGPSPVPKGPQVPTGAYGGS